MNWTYECIIYLLIINFVTGILFAYDKQAAKKNRRRIPEITLHFLELAGGVFVNFVLMYTLRHKNRKFCYWAWTLLIGFVWMMILLIIFPKTNLIL